MNPYVNHYLVIEKGEPRSKLNRIQLDSKTMMIGRSSASDEPDIIFESPYVSRKHAVLMLRGDSLVIEDLNSKHGTQINGFEIKPHQPFPVNNGDQITIAKGIVILTYKVDREFDDRTITMTNIFPKPEGLVSIDLDKRKVTVEGQIINFSGKEKELLLLLYCSKNKAVSYDEIRETLWPERKISGEAVPEVGNDEINALVYRLRKRLGKGAEQVMTVPRYGILFKTEEV